MKEIIKYVEIIELNMNLKIMDFEENREKKLRKRVQIMSSCNFCELIQKGDKEEKSFFGNRKFPQKSEAAQKAWKTEKISWNF